MNLKLNLDELYDIIEKNNESDLILACYTLIATQYGVYHKEIMCNLIANILEIVDKDAEGIFSAFFSCVGINDGKLEIHSDDYDYIIGLLDVEFGNLYLLLGYDSFEEFIMERVYPNINQLYIEKKYGFWIFVNYILAYYAVYGIKAFFPLGN